MREKIKGDLVKVDFLIPLFRDEMVELSTIPILEDNGIGKYEFWGGGGFDENWQWEIYDIGWDKSKYSFSENEKINKFIDDNIEIITTEFLKKIENDTHTKDLG